MRNLRFDIVPPPLSASLGAARCIPLLVVLMCSGGCDSKPGNVADKGPGRSGGRFGGHERRQPPSEQAAAKTSLLEYRNKFNSETTDLGDILSQSALILDGLSADAVENFARELLGAPLSQSDRVLLASCIRRLAVEKPDLALELFDESIRQGSMVEPNGLIEDLAKAHPDLLVSHLLKVSPNLREDGVSDRALVYLMARKDGYATDFFVGLSAREKTKYLSMFIGTEFMNDEEGTLEIARTKLGKDERDKAIGEVAGLFASNGDMARARKIIDAIPGGSAKDAAALEAVSAIALRSDHGVVDFSLARDMSAAALNSLFSKEYVMSLLVKRSPDDVLELLEKTVPTASNLNVLSRMAGQLIAENPAKTLDWISSQQEGASKSGLLNAAFAEWVKHDPNAALRQAGEMSAADQAASLRGIVKTLAISDYERSLQVAANSASENRQDMYREIARAVTLSSPDKAVAILDDPSMTQRLGADFRAQMLDHTVRNWAKQDVESAKAWVEKLPEGDRSNGVRGLMTPWMKSDPVAASQWLATLPAGPVRDEGAKVVIEQVKDTDPEMAEQWRKSLSPQGIEVK